MPPIFNAVANIATGFSLVLFQIAGTRIVASSSSDDLELWVLAVSFAGFAPLFAFNLNTGVARLAIRLVNRSTHELSSLLLFADRLARWYLGLAVIAGIIGSMLLQYVYPAKVDGEPILRVIGFFGFFIGSCWVVLAQPFQGVLIARQQNASIAKVTLLGRFLGLLVLWGAIRFIGSLPLALLACGTSLWLSYWLMKRDVPEWREWKAAPLEGRHDATLGEVSKGLAVWSITALLFQVCLVPLVGVIDPAAMTPIYLAVTLIAILVGLVNACTGALIAPLGRMIGEEAFAKVARLSWMVGAGLIIYSIFLILALPWILELWVGNVVDVAQVQRYFIFVAGLQCVRLSGSVSSVLLMVKADNRWLTGPSMFELVGLLGFAVPVGFMAGVQPMLAVLIVISCIAACATILMGASLTDVSPCDKRSLVLLCLPLSFAVAYVTTGFLLG